MPCVAALTLAQRAGRGAPARSARRDDQQGRRVRAGDQDPTASLQRPTRVAGGRCSPARVAAWPERPGGVGPGSAQQARRAAGARARPARLDPAATVILRRQRPGPPTKRRSWSVEWRRTQRRCRRDAVRSTTAVPRARGPTQPGPTHWSARRGGAIARLPTARHGNHLSRVAAATPRGGAARDRYPLRPRCRQGHERRVAAVTERPPRRIPHRCGPGLLQAAAPGLGTASVRPLALAR